MSWLQILICKPPRFRLNAENDNFVNVVTEQGRGNEPDKKCIKGANIYSDLDLRYVGVASKVLKNISACCGRETADLCPFDAVAKIRWVCRGEIVLCNGLVVSYGSMIAPFPDDSVARSVRFYQPSSS